jgi:hypothetical protein
MSPDAPEKHDRCIQYLHPDRRHFFVVLPPGEIKSEDQL